MAWAMKPDGGSTPKAPLSQWTANVRDAVRNNVAQASTAQQYYQNPTAYGGQPGEKPLIPIQQQPYVPPSALEKWEQERADDLSRRRREEILGGFEQAGGALERSRMLDADFFSWDAARSPEERKAAQDAALKEIERGKVGFYGSMTPEQQEANERAKLADREGLGRKQDIINDVEKLQAQDSALPDEEKQALQVLRQQLLYETPSKFGELDPLVITIRNLGTRSEFRKRLIDWKAGKSGEVASSVLPWGLDLQATGEEIDQAGGLGGFLQQSDTKSSNFDASPTQFGFLIHTDENGVDHIMKAEEWINLKITDLSPAPGDTPEERDRKAAGAADLISTLAFADKYNSFAKKRDAGYRIQLDAAGNPIRAYIHNDDKVALTNLIKDVLAMQEGGVIAPVDEFMKAYADERRGIAEVATGPYGDGSDDRSGGGGFRRYGGGGGYGGGGYGGGNTLVDPELLKMSVDSIARARMGRSLTPAESEEFIAHFHSLQSAFAAARSMGADAFSLDPEAQAVAWIESKMVKESAGHQAGNLVSALAEAMRSGRFSAN